MPGRRACNLEWVDPARRERVPSLDQLTMKAAMLVLAAVITLLMASIVWYRWDSGTNRGYTCGYWGQFNTVSNSLTKLSGITILEAGCNADVTLEEFGFEVLTAEGQQLHVWFSETDPLRKLSGQALSKELLQRIQD